MRGSISPRIYVYISFNALNTSERSISTDRKPSQSISLVDDERIDEIKSSQRRRTVHKKKRTQGNSSVDIGRSPV